MARTRVFPTRNRLPQQHPAKQPTISAEAVSPPTKASPPVEEKPNVTHSDHTYPAPIPDKLQAYLFDTYLPGSTLAPIPGHSLDPHPTLTPQQREFDRYYPDSMIRFERMCEEGAALQKELWRRFDMGDKFPDKERKMLFKAPCYARMLKDHRQRQAVVEARCPSLLPRPWLQQPQLQQKEQIVISLPKVRSPSDHLVDADGFKRPLDPPKELQKSSSTTIGSGAVSPPTASNPLPEKQEFVPSQRQSPPAATPPNTVTSPEASSPENMSQQPHPAASPVRRWVDGRTPFDPSLHAPPATTPRSSPESRPQTPASKPYWDNQPVQPKTTPNSRPAANPHPVEIRRPAQSSPVPTLPAKTEKEPCAVSKINPLSVRRIPLRPPSTSSTTAPNTMPTHPTERPVASNVPNPYAQMAPQNMVSTSSLTPTSTASPGVPNPYLPSYMAPSPAASAAATPRPTPPPATTTSTMAPTGRQAVPNPYAQAQMAQTRLPTYSVPQPIQNLAEARQRQQQRMSQQARLAAMKERRGPTVVPEQQQQYDEDARLRQLTKTQYKEFLLQRNAQKRSQDGLITSQPDHSVQKHARYCSPIVRQPAPKTAKPSKDATTESIMAILNREAPKHLEERKDTTATTAAIAAAVVPKIEAQFTLQRSPGELEEHRIHQSMMQNDRSLHNVACKVSS